MTLEARHVHCVGIGGIGTSGIARMLLARGSQVSGSDLRGGHLLEALRGLGAQVTVGHAPENIPSQTDLVVISAAIKPDNLVGLPSNPPPPWLTFPGRFLVPLV